MAIGQIKLGAKELSRKSLSGGQLEGFFYWRRLDWPWCPSELNQRGRRRKLRWAWFSKLGEAVDWGYPARQAPNFSDNMAEWQNGLLHGSVSAETDGRTLRLLSKASKWMHLLSWLWVRIPPQPLFNTFYDNPSQKRDARCTNILHTGATLSGVGEGQRLRKGFQSSGVCETLRGKLDSVGTWLSKTAPNKQVELLPTFESLSSVAKLRLIGEEYEVMRDSPLPCLYL